MTSKGLAALIIEDQILITENGMLCPTVLGHCGLPKRVSVERLILTKPVELVLHGLGLSHMTVEQYFILRDNNEWKISFNDKLYGPYDTQQDAIEAAIDAAYAMGEIGIDAQVLVQDTDQKLRTAWSYAQDFYTSGR